MRVQITLLALLSVLAVPLTPTHAHDGPTIAISVEDDALRARGGNISSGAITYRAYDNVIHAHWTNLTAGSDFATLSNPTITVDTAALNGYDISFDILSGLYTWDGQGTPSLSPTAQTVSISQGSSFVTSNGGFVSGFQLASGVTADQDIDEHSYTMSGHPLVWYALELQINADSASNPDYVSSPVWVIFAPDKADIPGDYSGAMPYGHYVHMKSLDFEEYISQNVIPEPASLALLAIGALSLLKRRRNS